MSDSLGDRMKNYENAYRLYLPKRLPLIIRVDGRAFHTFTRHMEKPFDENLHAAMVETAKALCKEISGAKFAYTQSDEISLLVTNDMPGTEPWFNNNLQKIVSLAAARASVTFNSCMNSSVLFDARVFILPENEVNNYFYWRQLDAMRNSVQMAAYVHFSHKQRQHKSCDELLEMLRTQKNIDWNDYEVWKKCGTCIVKETYYKESPNAEEPVLRSEWVEVADTPNFHDNPYYIENVWKGEDK